MLKLFCFQQLRCEYLLFIDCLFQTDYHWGGLGLRGTHIRASLKLGPALQQEWEGATASSVHQQGSLMNLWGRRREIPAQLTSAGGDAIPGVSHTDHVMSVHSRPEIFTMIDE